MAEDTIGLFINKINNEVEKHMNEVLKKMMINNNKIIIK